MTVTVTCPDGGEIIAENGQLVVVDSPMAQAVADQALGYIDVGFTIEARPPGGQVIPSLDGDTAAADVLNAAIVRVTERWRIAGVPADRTTEIVLAVDPPEAPPGAVQ